MYVARSNRAEVAVIECCELLLAESLDDRDGGGIDEPEPQVAVAIQELPNPYVVGSLEIDDRDRPVLDIGQEFHEGRGTEPLAREPVELDHHRSRHHKLLTGSGQELNTGSVVAVGAVHCGVERAGVANQRHERG